MTDRRLRLYTANTATDYLKEQIGQSMKFGICMQVFVVVVGFVALRPKSTAMVIAGRSVHLTTLFPGQA